MSREWADKIADDIVNRGPMEKGICLILGASDTGKTTLAAALANRVASSRPVVIVDADIGQSHIGPPTTAGWAVVDNPVADFSQLTPEGIGFVGDVTPLRHLLQLTAAVSQCVRQAREAADVLLIDTPGLVRGPAAAALWWTMHRILQPRLILAVQRNDELEHTLSGLKAFDSVIERIECPPHIPLKSTEHRRDHRRICFRKYFQDSRLYDVDINAVAVQPGLSFDASHLLNCLVALRDGRGVDLALGIITSWQSDKNIAAIKAPRLDPTQIHALVLGDISLDATEL
ncbi:MAG: Clp1/GlmU family protein [Planctomycetota bacterium]|jgi:polynucleotide 5'-hydroxyl-kinase GRC3/NOL9